MRDFGTLRKAQGVIYIDAEIFDDVLDLAVTEQDLNGSQIAGDFVDHRGLGPAQRMRSIFCAVQTGSNDPFVDQTCILARAEMAGVVDPAWEQVIASPTTTLLQPC
ncbi:hypothetical protein KC8_19150 [Sphingomonas sp. KC8]|nr:hypothetical protein KC8_19150 [Sphingomonas sp. KC8]